MYNHYPGKPLIYAIPDISCGNPDFMIVNYRKKKEK
jgi:hypothetical protein